MSKASTSQLRLPRAFAGLLLACSLALIVACDGGEPSASTAPDAPAAVPGSAQQEQSQVGDASVTAVALQTSQIPAAVASEHGIEQRDDLVMLRISPRQGAAGAIASAPAQVQATVTDLSGQTRGVELEERVINGLVDHVGTVQTTLPETLRFDITVSSGGESETLEITRQFQAR